MSPTPYPPVAETPTNAPMLAAWRHGRLALQKCGDCGLVFFYPRACCLACWSERLAWIEAAGTGTIVSFSLVHRPLNPAFDAEAPIVLAEISLPEGASLIARVITRDPASVQIGSKVVLVPPPDSLRYPLPTFRL